ncbi:MAG: aminoacetone oxidase family FAD-binding enzyme [Bacteroidales bacterium]|nr:aminoacetone oxidase family FAD-binding enzyme [Bacteroidales bacterium]
MSRRPEIAIIGAGAAGCFCGAVLAERGTDAGITVFEAGRRPLAKVAVTGGGRCNLTNSFRGISTQKAYPRGARLMKRLLAGFSNTDACDWFTAHGVDLVLQDDECVFPKSQDAMQIVGTLLSCLRRGGVSVETEAPVRSIEPLPYGGFILHFEGRPSFRADAVVVTIGGLSSARMQELFQGLDIELVKPVPSLFTIKTDSPVTGLAGTVVKDASISLQGTKLSAEGPLLITDWGFSGPAVLKLSSHGARVLSENGYKGTVAVNWMHGSSEQDIRSWIERQSVASPERQISALHPEKLSSRLWKFILDKASIKENTKFAQLSSRQTGRLCSALLSDCYPVTGRARFKEEFVTCGGVALGEVFPASLESRRYAGLYFAGEVLDIDAITGGFNLQAAWTTGFTVAGSIGNKLNNK